MIRKDISEFEWNMLFQAPNVLNMVTISQPDFNSNPLLLFTYVNVLCYTPEIDTTLQVNYIRKNKTEIDNKKNLSVVLPLRLKAFLP